MSGTLWFVHSVEIYIWFIISSRLVYTGMLACPVLHSRTYARRAYIPRSRLQTLLMIHIRAHVLASAFSLSCCIHIIYRRAYDMRTRATTIFICLFYLLCHPRARTPVFFYCLIICLYYYCGDLPRHLSIVRGRPLIYLLVGYYLLAHNLTFI